jgi:hypothetical protein
MRFTIIFSFVFIGYTAGSCLGQTTPSKPFNEEFDLNIAERRITESDFAASTAIMLEASELRLQVGARVNAARIDVTLRGVTGHVRFRASLEELIRRLPRLTQTTDIR